MADRDDQRDEVEGIGDGHDGAPPRGPFALRRAPAQGDVVAHPLRRHVEEDDGLPNPEDVKRLSEPATKRCPHCKKEVYEDTDICYHCGLAISGSRSNQSTIVIVVVILVVFAMIWTTLRGGRLF